MKLAKMYIGYVLNDRASKPRLSHAKNSLEISLDLATGGRLSGSYMAIPHVHLCTFGCKILAFIHPFDMQMVTEKFRS